jgi:NAD(P)-dependent dehydrogenase (short-subunit alcohol dehydrogenase family)
VGKNIDAPIGGGSMTKRKAGTDFYSRSPKRITADWTDKVAIITVGASGIGEATAAEFAFRGAKVVILDLVQPSTSSSNVRFISCDVSSSHEVEIAAAKISKEFGNVAFLVNSAGIQRYGIGVTTSEKAWDEVMAINVKAMFLSFRVFSPLMKVMALRSSLSLRCKPSGRCPQNLWLYSRSMKTYDHEALSGLA